MSRLAEVKVINIAIDNLDGLTLFQRAILKDIHYFNRYKGEYKFIKTFIIDKYTEVISAEDLIIEVNALAEAGAILTDLKKTIHNGKFVTNKIFKLNYENLNLLDYYE
jgi:hypothetical protein